MKIEILPKLNDFISFKDIRTYQYFSFCGELYQKINSYGSVKLNVLTNQLKWEEMTKAVQCIPLEIESITFRRIL